MPEDESKLTEVPGFPADPVIALAVRKATERLENVIGGMKEELRLAQRAARWRTLWVCLLGLACTGVAFVAVLALTTASQERATAGQARAAARQAQAITQQVVQGSLRSCLDGNANRAGTVLAIDRLVTLLVNGSKDPATLKAERTYEAYVLAVNAPQNCYAVYHVKPPVPGVPAGAAGASALP
jgi:hypothetical protein